MTPKFEVPLSDTEINTELERLRALPIQRSVKKDVKRKKKREKTETEITEGIFNVFGISEEDKMKAKLVEILNGGIVGEKKTS